jgi:hypothetical protein
MHSGRPSRQCVSSRSAFVPETAPDFLGLPIKPPFAPPELGLIGNLATLSATEKPQHARIQFRSAFSTTADEPRASSPEMASRPGDGNDLGAALPWPTISAIFDFEPSGFQTQEGKPLWWFRERAIAIQFANIDRDCSFDERVLHLSITKAGVGCALGTERWPFPSCASHRTAQDAVEELIKGRPKGEKIVTALAHEQSFADERVDFRYA